MADRIHSLLDTLNPSQRRAAEHHCGPLLVVAGAGSGKTRALTFRIAHLIRTHNVPPAQILAVTFTNKAAKEMKSRIETLFAQQEALGQHNKPLNALDPDLQTRLRSGVYRRFIKPLSVGTFHSLFSRILRIEIEKFRDEQGRRWTRTFSIFDDNDSHSLVKEIVTKQLNLDDRRFDPRSIRYGISNAKNMGLTPREYAAENSTQRGQKIAQAYERYQDQLAANNALDFDDLIMIPVQLFRQCPDVLDYWHQRYRHILVDEYQDTNRTQYELIRLLATNGEHRKENINWRDRSIFVVGDGDQSIYRFRGADFTILMEFQGAFGDGLPDDDTRTMVKLEENYRSTATILDMANALILNNTERIDKQLKATRDPGDLIVCHQAANEIDEAEFAVEQIREMQRQGRDFGDFAILYRTNAQSRPFEEALLRWGIPYTVVGGLKFYDRKEIKDVLAYLRAIFNPSDSVSLLRIINTPRRGIGKSTIDKLSHAATTLGVPLWEVLGDETSVHTVAGRAARPVIHFARMIRHWHEHQQQAPASEILAGILGDSNYLDDLEAQGTDEAQERAQNVRELFNAARQYEEDDEDSSLASFLSNVSLATDLDNVKEGGDRVSLMTLHSSKGLEFPVVFLVGLEQNLFPNFRAIEDPVALEEERRLCYVGITRAQDQLYLSYTQERRLYGSREPAVPSLFLKELPTDLLQLDSPQPILTTKSTSSSRSLGSSSSRSMPVSLRVHQWSVGDRLEHPQFGQGQITHVFGSGQKVTLAVKFPGLGQQKILDPSIAPLEKLG